MQGVSLPSEVTHVAPSATIQSGVVNYKVKVEIESLQSITQERQQARSNLSSGNITSGTLPERMKQAVEEGRITQEQVEEMMKRRQQAQTGESGRMSATETEDFELAEGMTVTVSIITQERSNVLLIPIQAVISRGRGTFVQVLKDGATEERSITVGISNWQYTEVTSGLSEGEQVVVPQGTTTTTTTPQQRQGQSGGIPREMRRMLR
ncbi:hypothetical protein ACFLVW_00150 [Chloroflexota bacterium]